MRDTNQENIQSFVLNAHVIQNSAKQSEEG